MFIWNVFSRLIFSRSKPGYKLISVTSANKVSLNISGLCSKFHPWTPFNLFVSSVAIISTVFIFDYADLPLTFLFHGVCLAAIAFKHVSVCPIVVMHQSVFSWKHVGSYLDITTTIISVFGLIKSTWVCMWVFFDLLYQNHLNLFLMIFLFLMMFVFFNHLCFFDCEFRIRSL